MVVGQVVLKADALGEGVGPRYCVSGECESSGGGVLGDAFGSPGTGDGHDPGVLGQQPGERDLAEGAFVHGGSPRQAEAAGLAWLAAAYCSSVTGSSQVVPSPSSVPSSMAMWLLVPSKPAPIPCCSPGGVQAVSPGRMRMTVPSRLTTRPVPSV